MDVAQLSISVDSSDVKNADKAMQSAAKAASGLESMVQKAAAAFGLFKAAQFAKDAMLLAARFETLGVVMNVAGNNAGYTAKEMTTFEKALQATGISLVESRNVLTSMATANIDLAKSTKLARAAQDLAVVGNLNSSEAFEKMVHGIKSGQTEILRTMGLNVQFEEGYKKLGRELKKNAQDLTAKEKLQSRTNQVLQESTKYQGIYEAAMGTTGKQLKSMERYAQDLEVAFGKVFTPALGTAVQALNQGFADLKKWTEGNREKLDSLGQSMGDTIGQAIKLGKAIAGINSDATSAVDGLSSLRWVSVGIGGIFAASTDAVNGLRKGINLMWAENFKGAASALRMAESIAQKLPGGDGAATGFGATALGLESSATEARRRALEIANNPLALETWLKDLDKIKTDPSHTDKLGDGGKAEEEKQRNAKLKEEAAQRYAKELERQQKFLQGMNQELLKMDSTERQIAQIRIEAERLSPANKRKAEEIADQAEAVREWRESWKSSLRTIEDLKKAMDSLPISPGAMGSAEFSAMLQRRQMVEMQYNPAASMAAGMADLDRLHLTPDTYSKALRDLRYEFDATFRTLSDGMMNLGDNMARSFANWIMKIDGAKFALKDLARSFAADMASMFAQQASRQFMGWVMGGISSAWGGFGAAPASGSGGVPWTGGAITPSSSIGAGASPSIVVNVNGATGAVDASGGNGAGVDLGKRIAGAVRAVIADEMRPGGQLASVRR